MYLTRQEINLRRLLAKCELLSSKKKDDERLPDYVSSLELMLRNVSGEKSPSKNALDDYYKRIHAIKVEVGLSNENSKHSLESMREELFELRHRNKGLPETDDVDELLQYHDNMQRKITSDMLLLTQNLKEQSQLANKIIKKDTELVGKSLVLTDQNNSKLEVESSKLAEHSKRAWKCWMWITLLIVIVVFINMILLMKVVKKKY